MRKKKKGIVVICCLFWILMPSCVLNGFSQSQQEILLKCIYLKSASQVGFSPQLILLPAERRWLSYMTLK